MTKGLSKREVLFFLSALIIVSTLVAYEPIRHNEFVQYDDRDYITENPDIKAGITWQSLGRAFTQPHFSTWHPLTTLSHILDCEIYGLNPLGHHITNLLIHIANSVLLFLLLSRITGAVWRSGFVAAAFALHPIHVESVAWAAERKDVLSGLFWMLTILAYVHYAWRPNIRRYAVVLLAFVMGLLSKPMVVTLPFVLLLLDYWPLDRLIWRRNNSASINEEHQNASATYQRATLWQLLVEKVPMFVLSAILCVITFVVQKQGGAVVSLKNFPLGFRIINAVGCYFSYIAKIFYPKELGVLYPPPMQVTTDAAITAVMGVVVLLALWGRGRRWLVVGLLWYLGTLVPVIGLVQVGSQVMADRYTYLPSIGVFIIVAWGAAEIFAKLSLPKPMAAAAGAAVMIIMVLMTQNQVGYWRDTPTLYKRAVTAIKDNYIMLNTLGVYLCEHGRPEEGIQYIKESVRIVPNYMAARGSICQAYLALNKFDGAISCFNEALQKANGWPETYKMYSGLGWAYEQKGELALAETNFRKALMLKPDYQSAQNGLKSVLTKQGRRTESGNPEF